jgi:hypothetical protein
MNTRLRARLAKRRATPERQTIQRLAAFGAAESIAFTTPPSSPRRSQRHSFGDRVMVALGWATVAAIAAATVVAAAPN